MEQLKVFSTTHTCALDLVAGLHRNRSKKKNPALYLFSALHFFRKSELEYGILEINALFLMAWVDGGGALISLPSQEAPAMGLLAPPLMPSFSLLANVPKFQQSLGFNWRL